MVLKWLLQELSIEGTLKGDVNILEYVIFKVCMQNLQGFEILLVFDPQLSWEDDVKMVDNPFLSSY